MKNLGTGVTFMIDFTQEEKDFFMSEALKEAQKSLDKAEIPIGCIIVKDGEIVGRGHTMRVRNLTKQSCMLRSWLFRRQIGPLVIGVCLIALFSSLLNLA